MGVLCSQRENLKRHSRNIPLKSRFQVKCHCVTIGALYLWVNAPSFTGSLAYYVSRSYIQGYIHFGWRQAVLSIAFGEYISEAVKATFIQAVCIGLFLMEV
jgi:hypothetical protein